MRRNKSKLKVIPLGGVEEIGKNITVFEYGDEIIVVDCGIAFPEDELLGVDLVIPDISYLIKNKKKVKGFIITHGHEDHIGALPYVLKELNFPVYGTKLTIGLIENKLYEHKMINSAKLVKVGYGDKITFNNFEVEMIRSNHSIADTAGLAIDTPVGMVIHTSDFKIDYTPIRGETIDLARYAELGRRGVLLLLSDSTNVERPGYTMSERTVGDTFIEIFGKAKGRIFVATFSSNVHRVQQIINAANRYNRKVVLCGRSMINVVKVADDLGYLDIPDGTLIDLDDIQNYKDNKLVIITTGSQGEPMAALTQMSSSNYKWLEIKPGDLVIISADPIPGNEKLVSRVINDLFKIGAEVIYESIADTHVSGHACQEELKLIHTLVKPKYFMPVHGEYRHLVHHAKLAQELGMDKRNIFIPKRGQVIEFDENSARVSGVVANGRVLVDGLGVGDVGNIVLRDRKHLSQDGLLVVVVTISRDSGKLIAGPDIISRGFVYVRESEDLLEKAKNLAYEELKKCEMKNITDWATLKSVVRDVLRNYLYNETKRNPMILPIIMEI